MRADSRTFKIQDFRNDLYNMLIYNLDVSECICHILFYTIENGYIRSSDLQDVLYETYTFFKYYNNNYRPIYHLESMIFFIMNKNYQILHCSRYFWEEKVIFYNNGLVQTAKWTKQNLICNIKCGLFHGFHKSIWLASICGCG